MCEEVVIAWSQPYEEVVMVIAWSLDQLMHPSGVAALLSGWVANLYMQTKVANLYMQTL